MKTATPLVVKGRVAVEDVGTRVIVSDARPIERMIEQAAKVGRGTNGANLAERRKWGAEPAARARVAGSHRSGGARPVEETFLSRPGRCKVAFDLVTDDGSEATLEASSAVQADGELLSRVREICGEDSVAVVQ